MIFKERQMLNLQNQARETFNKPLADCSNSEIYKILLDFVQNESQKLPVNDSKRKLYYV